MNLVPLFEEALEFQDYNGTVLSNGKAAVYYIGRTRLADIYNDVAAEYPAENPRILDNLGMGPVYVNPAFDYELVVFDAYDNELFSVKKYIHSKGEHSTANVVVTPSESIAVSAWTVGDVQVYMPYLTGQLGKVYTGIEPIVVNNTEDKISANHVPLGVQDPLYFVQDDEEGCIIGCSAQTEIPAELSGKWDEASDAVIANSAQWAEGTEYEAGSYVSIDGHTINVTGLQSEGDYAYNSALSSKLDVTALPQDLVHSGDLTAYYPASNPSGFITGVDLSDYATTAQLDEKLDKTDSGNFYPMEGNPSGFLTEHQSLDGYATEQWVENKGYITGIDIQESAGWNEATTVINNNSAIWNNTTNVVSSNSAQWGASNPQIPVTGINGIKISESGNQVVFEVSGDYATTAQLADKQDSLSYGYHDTAISSIDESALYDTSAHARINTLAGRISDLSSNKLDTSAFSDVSGTFLTAVPDTYLQNTDLTTTDGKVTAISGIPLSAGGNVAVYTDAALPNSTQLDADIAAGKAICIVYEGRNYWFDRKSSDYYFYGADAYSTFLYYLFFRPTNNSWSQGQRVLATKSWVTAGMTAYQPVGDYLSATDSANFYTTANESGFISEVPAGTMNESAFEYDANDKISGYNGSAFAGGSDVPEGVMVESGLEYNAVNEISGYNGSAIAQYGAEKQWLVHDDTLVHASNSAQYALGVNISAIQQLMGIDETVLFESANAVTNAPLSESMTAFNRVRVSLANDFTDTGLYQTVIDLDVEHGSHVWEPVGGLGITNMWVGVNMLSANTDYTILTAPKAKLINFGNWTAQGTGIVGSTTGANVNVILKVIGIGRKQ